MKISPPIKTALNLPVAVLAVLGLAANPAKAELIDGLVEFWELDGEFGSCELKRWSSLSGGRYCPAILCEHKCRGNGRDLLSDPGAR